MERPDTVEDEQVQRRAGFAVPDFPSGARSLPSLGCEWQLSLQ